MIEEAGKVDLGDFMGLRVVCLAGFHWGIRGVVILSLAGTSVLHSAIPAGGFRFGCWRKRTQHDGTGRE